MKTPRAFTVSALFAAALLSSCLESGGRTTAPTRPPLPRANPAGMCGSPGPRGQAPAGTRACGRGSSECQGFCDLGNAASCTQLAYSHLFHHNPSVDCVLRGNGGNPLWIPSQQCAFQLLNQACGWGDYVACQEYSRAAEPWLAAPFNAVGPFEPSHLMTLYRLQNYAQGPLPPGTPALGGFRILGQAMLLDPPLREEVLDILGRRTSFAPLGKPCLFPEMGLKIALPGRPPMEVLISFSCNRMVGQGFAWPHRCDGMTDSTIARLSWIQQKSFGM